MKSKRNRNYLDCKKTSSTSKNKKKSLVISTLRNKSSKSDTNLLWKEHKQKEEKLMEKLNSYPIPKTKFTISIFSVIFFSMMRLFFSLYLGVLCKLNPIDHIFVHKLTKRILQGFSKKNREYNRSMLIKFLDSFSLLLSHFVFNLLLMVCWNNFTSW